MVYVVLVQHYLMHCFSCGLQGEQQAANSRHEAEVFELKHQVSCLNSLVERGNHALQQKAQVRTTASSQCLLHLWYNKMGTEES